MERRSIATAAQTALGIEAFIVEIPGGDGQLVEFQGFTQSPKMSYPQYVGFAMASDGEAALANLEARVVTFATDIEAELAPACACGAPLIGDGCINFPPTISPKKPAKSKKTKAPKRNRYDFPDAGDIRAGFRLEVQRTNGLMRDLEAAA